MSALVPLLIAIINADYLHHLYRETLSYTPIVGHLYLWCGGFALFAFIITLAREIVKDIEDKLGDCEMECRTIPIVWGDTTAKIITTGILITAAALIGYVAFAVLPFPHEWRTLSTRYVIFGLITPIIGTLILLWSAKTPQEYHRTQLVIKFVMFMGVLYSFVIQQNLLSL